MYSGGGTRKNYRRMEIAAFSESVHTAKRSGRCAWVGSAVAPYAGGS